MQQVDTMQYVVTKGGQPESRHASQTKAMAHCRHQIDLCHDAGAKSPIYAVWDNASGEMLWQSLPSSEPVRYPHFINQLNEMGVIRPLSRAIQVF